MSDEYTPEMLAMLEAQREYFASDDLIRHRAEPWRDATPEECWQEVKESCAATAFWMSQYSPEVFEGALVPDPLPPDSVLLLEALQRQSR